jgi:hypothetical protein
MAVFDVISVMRMFCSCLLLDFLFYSLIRPVNHRLELTLLHSTLLYFFSLMVSPVPSYLIPTLHLHLHPGAPAGQPAHTIVSSVLPATIVDHTRHDENVNEGKVPEYTKPNARRQCTIS